MKQPRYETLRAETPFRWSVGSSYLALLELTKIPIRDFFLKPDAGVELYRRGMSLQQEMFGDAVPAPAISTPPVSYGHINAHGVELVFPEGGEVNYDHSPRSLESLITMVAAEVDYPRTGIHPLHTRYRDELQKAFPGRPVGFGPKAEGPMTSAYLLRGEPLFYDAYDSPGLLNEFLSVLVDSIHRYRAWEADREGRPHFSAESGSLADDVAAMFGPSMWPELVLPHLGSYFTGVTSGRRSAHIEDLRPDHLPLLEALGLSFFDPSISARLTPRIIADRCRVPFNWRLMSFHYHDMSVEDVADWVFLAVADGASSVNTGLFDTMCNERTVPKVHRFIEAARTVERALAEGATREDIRSYAQGSAARAGERFKRLQR